MLLPCFTYLSFMIVIMNKNSKISSYCIKNKHILIFNPLLIQKYNSKKI